MEAYASWNQVPSSEAAAPAGMTPATLARNILQAFLEQRWDTLATLIHPDADLEAGFSVAGARFDVKHMMDAAWAAATSGAYLPVYELVMTIDEETAVVAVRIRFQIGRDEFSERDAAYLMTFKDSLLWRNRIYNSVDEAVTAHQAGEPEAPSV